MDKIYSRKRIKIPEFRAEESKILRKTLKTLLIVLIATILGILGLGVYCGFPEVALETAEWSEPYTYTTHQIVNFSDNRSISTFLSDIIK